MEAMAAVMAAVVRVGVRVGVMEVEMEAARVEAGKAAATVAVVKVADAEQLRPLSKRLADRPSQSPHCRNSPREQRRARTGCSSCH